MGKVKDIIGYLEPDEQLVQSARRAVCYLEHLQEEQEIDTDLLFDLDLALRDYDATRCIPF